MTKITEIAFVGYPVTDMVRARKFYEGVLGLVQSSLFENGGKSWVEYDIGAGTLAVTNMSPEWTPSTMGPAAAFEVADFPESIRTLEAAGARFLIKPCESPVCWMAVVTDPDGNSLCIHKRKTT